MRTNRLSPVAARAGACLLAGVASGWSLHAAGANPVAPVSGLPRIVAYVSDGTAVDVIHPEKLTHINFAFARINAQGEVVLPHPGVAPQLAQLRGLKTRNPQLKILLSAGGWPRRARSSVMKIRDHWTPRRTSGHIDWAGSCSGS